MILNTINGWQPYTINSALPAPRLMPTVSTHFYYPLPKKEIPILTALKNKFWKALDWVQSFDPDSPRNRLITATTNYAQAYMHRFNDQRVDVRFASLPLGETTDAREDKALNKPLTKLKQGICWTASRMHSSNTLRFISKAFPNLPNQVAEELLYMA